MAVSEYTAVSSLSYVTSLLPLPQKGKEIAQQIALQEEGPWRKKAGRLLALKWK